MARKENESLIAGGKICGEIRQFAAGLPTGQILSMMDLESNLFERFGDRSRIVCCFQQNRQIAVCIVANHQRDAFCGRGVE